MIVLRGAAEADVRAAVEYYDSADFGLGDQFIEELDRLLLRLSEFPRSGRQVQGYGPVRRALLRRFPFAVFYVEQEAAVVVLRVIHAARSKDQWPEDG